MSLIRKFKNKIQKLFNHPTILEIGEPIPRPLGRLSRYGLSILILAITTGIGILFELSISPTNLVMLYLLAVLVTAVYLGRKPSIFVSVLGVLLFDFLFIPPYYTFAVDDTEYIITFAGLLLVGLVISAFATKAREQTEEALSREADTLLLYTLGRDLFNATNHIELAKVVHIHFPAAISNNMTLYFPVDKMLTPFPKSNDVIIPDSERDLVEWTYKYGQPSGLGTTILPSLEPRFLPLLIGAQCVGVMSMVPHDPTQSLPPEQERLLAAFINQICQSLERIRLLEQTHQIEMLRATEKLQNTLLNSISHDLRTPLVTITGTLTTLEQEGFEIDSITARNLITTAREEADRLNRLVGNLLDITRLEAGALKVKEESVEIVDLIGSTIGSVSNRIGKREILVDAAGTGFARFDFVLISSVLANLIENADKYAPVGTPIRIIAKTDQKFLTIQVIDQADPIPENELDRLFTKFYRSQKTSKLPGTGLGLAICKGFVEAHNGIIWAENKADGGNTFIFQIPI